MLEKLERFNRKLSLLFEWIGFVAILLMIAITCIDVVGAKVFNWRLFGAIDIVMLSQIVAIAFATGITLILGRHIQVEFFLALFPPPFRAIINSLIHFLGLGFFGLIIWRLTVLGYSFQISGEHSATADIPYYPFAYGIALACIPVCSILLLEFIKSLKRITGK